jgi:hypothetical protein
MSTQYVNIAAYKFITLDNLEALRPQYQDLCNELGLKGTVLLTPEGINMFLSGTREHIDQYLAWVRSDARLADLEWKESLSTEQSHKRMLVKIKKEIITMRMPLIKPELGRAPSVDPKTLKRWLDQGHDDEGVPVVMMETRNAFEVDVGTFENTLDYRIEKFSEFPEVVAIRYQIGAIRQDFDSPRKFQSGRHDIDFDLDLLGGELFRPDGACCEEGGKGWCYQLDERRHGSFSSLGPREIPSQVRPYRVTVRRERPKTAPPSGKS